MALILKGKPVADKISETVKAQIEELKSKGVEPTLAILRVGEREDDLSYERGASKRCEMVGMNLKKIVLPLDVDQDTLMAKIDELNKDTSVHGVLMFRPLPKQLDENAARNALDPAKDVDGITDGSLAGVFAGTDTGFCPCTAEAAVKILEHYEIDIQGKDVTVIGRSLVIGKPVAMLLMKRNATVTNCHHFTKNVEEKTKRADIVITSAGHAEIFGAEHFSEGQAVVDVGIDWNEEKQKICGDVRFDEVEPIVSAITPVPGGVGAVTTSVLVSHVVEAAMKSCR